MTINEIEARTGLDRGTVRYYEQEGLIKPAREQNGYRNYSEDNLEKLLKIKLLRSLNFSVDDIRAMDLDASDFQQRLRARARSLEAKQEDLEDAKRVIRQMIDGGERYETLNAGLYLTALRDGTPALTAPEEVAAPADSPPEPEQAGPWRRYFARSLDWYLLSLLYIFVTMGLMGVDYRSSSFWGDVLFTVLLMALTVLVEPLFLCTLGATPGKLLLGMRVLNENGQKLSYTDAFGRTLGVLFCGEGLHVPIVSLWRLIRSRKDASDGYALPWEGGSTVYLRDRRGWRPYVCAGCFVLGFVLVLGIAFRFYLPPNRGELTPEELAENVNTYSTRVLDANRWVLEPDGTWRDTFVPDPHTVYLFLNDFTPAPVELTVENGVVTGLSWRQTAESYSLSVLSDSFSAYVRALTLSLAGADRSQGLFRMNTLEDMASRAGSNGLTTAYGPWQIDCTVSSEETAKPDVTRFTLELTVVRAD